MKNKLEWLYQNGYLKNILKPKLRKNPKQIKQLARENIERDDKQLNKNLVKNMINLLYFTDILLQVGFSFALDGDHINHLSRYS